MRIILLIVAVLFIAADAKTKNAEADIYRLGELYEPKDAEGIGFSKNRAKGFRDFGIKSAKIISFNEACVEEPCLTIEYFVSSFSNRIYASIATQSFKRPVSSTAVLEELERKFNIEIPEKPFIKHGRAFIVPATDIKSTLQSKVRVCETAQFASDIKCEYVTKYLDDHVLFEELGRVALKISLPPVAPHLYGEILKSSIRDQKRREQVLFALQHGDDKNITQVQKVTIDLDVFEEHMMLTLDDFTSNFSKHAKKALKRKVRSINSTSNWLVSSGQHIFLSKAELLNLASSKIAERISSNSELGMKTLSPSFVSSNEKYKWPIKYENFSSKILALIESKHVNYAVGYSIEYSSERPSNDLSNLRTTAANRQQYFKGRFNKYDLIGEQYSWWSYPKIVEHLTSHFGVNENDIVQYKCTNSKTTTPNLEVRNFNSQSTVQTHEIDLDCWGSPDMNDFYPAGPLNKRFLSVIRVPEQLDQSRNPLNYVDLKDINNFVVSETNKSPFCFKTNNRQVEATIGVKDVDCLNGAVSSSASSYDFFFVYGFQATEKIPFPIVDKIVRLGFDAETAVAGMRETSKLFESVNLKF